MKIAIDYLLFSHFWFATPQLVLQADWQEVWHSPQPPFLALSHRLRVSRVLILSITCISDLSDSNGFPGEPPADSHLKIGKILAYHPHKVKVFQRFPPIKNVKKANHQEVAAHRRKSPKSCDSGDFCRRLPDPNQLPHTQERKQELAIRQMLLYNAGEVDRLCE